MIEFRYSQVEEILMTRYKGHRVSMLLSHYSPGISTHSPTPKLSKPCLFGLLWKLHRVGMTDSSTGHCQVKLQPLSSLEVREARLNVPTL